MRRRSESHGRNMLRKMQIPSGVVIGRRLHVRDLARVEQHTLRNICLRKSRSVRTLGTSGGGGGSGGSLSVCHQDTQEKRKFRTVGCDPVHK